MDGLNLFEMTYEELVRQLRLRYGKGGYHATALYRNVFGNGTLHLKGVPEFDKSVRLADEIESDLAMPSAALSQIVTEDAVIKFVTRYGDGCTVESVIIPMKQYHTLCVSTQVGCRQGCRFCKTGMMGFRRNLSAGEIVSQVFLAKFELGKDIRNVVFMGMGEPLDNVEAVIRAARVISDQKGFDIAPRHITISTVGVEGGIDRLGNANLTNLNLALSLNASNDALRSELMPANKRYSMDRIKAALHRYPLRRNGIFFIAYVLVKGVNDTPGHAAELVAYLDSLPVRVNVIPFNRVEGIDFREPSDADVHRFSAYLEDKGIMVRKRWRKGSELHAACGQLGMN